MFERISESRSLVTIYVDGMPVHAREGDSVAAAMMSLKSPQVYRLSQVNGLPRAPYCMIGHCHECLVEIEGRANQLGCLVEVADGMRIRRQLGRAEVET